MKRTSIGFSPSGSAKRKPADCPHCGGAGWVHRLLQPGESTAGAAFTERGLAKLVACRICNGTDRRQEYLQRICGLQGAELEASFSNYWLGTECRRAALGAAQRVLKVGGWLTLTGAFGTGKTYLLQAIVNEARKGGREAVYMTMTRLLDHLRDAFKPGAEVEYSGLWDVVCKADVLCLDEAEKFNATPWVQERLFDLANRRYQSWYRGVTCWATNNIADAPGYLKSRLLDGRFTIVKFDDKDLRPRLRREEQLSYG